MSDSMNEPRIGLALSGGGSRAIAFHLGCLRALHELGLLEKVKIISTVSGGSVIGTMYAVNEDSFSDFEKRVRGVLSRGFAKLVVRKALTTMEGLKALICWGLIAIIKGFFWLVSPLSWLVSFLISPNNRHRWHQRQIKMPMRRFASRTTILHRVLDDELFLNKRFSDLPDTAPRLIVNVAELSTGSAFYFSRKRSGSWRLGELANNDFPLAYAVTASAAYPLFLPALDENLIFKNKDGSRCERQVVLTDGGVYDNLGLAPLWPDRDPAISLNVSKVDSIICCRAGYGLRLDPPNQFLLSRLQSAFSCLHDRSQNAAAKRLFDFKKFGVLDNVLLPYLGQDDKRLRYPPDDLVKREVAYNYPTNFSAMPEEWIEKLSNRGEQLTRALIAEHWSEFLKE